MRSRQSTAAAAALGGLDTLVFAGGIGETAPLVRARICEGLSFLGIELNESRTAETAGVISTDAIGAGSDVAVEPADVILVRSNPLAAGALYAWGVLLTPALGAVLMSAGTVIVAINARLLRLKN